MTVALDDRPYARRTLVALMEDRPGVLSHVANLFRRRNYNIESLTVGHTEIPGISRMTVVVCGDDAVVEQVIKQLYKLINVTKVTAINDDAAVVRELALIKVHATSANRSEIKQLVDIFRAQIIDVSPESMTVEITGTEDKVESLISMLRPFGIKEMARTGRVAMVRGAAPNGAPL
ncbi:MAG TPA: acetolactate synthase small subunit [Chloroflexi bacterium]|jgi:acetolactate synthase-1/3 small subunit|nr:acetolactate synthase small subunit [Chloroflexota bacterium]